jgi:alpha-1,2-mannosyltransferase
VAWTAGTFLLLPGDSVTYWTSAIFDSGRLGNNAGTENQSIRGLLLRFFLPGHLPGALWVVIALAVAVAGFAVARRLARDGGEMAGIAVTALLLLLVSPVAWIHYFLIVIIAIGAIAGDGRLARRMLIAVAAAVVFLLKIPWWGHSLVSDAAVPRPVSRLVEGAFGIAAAVLLMVIARMRLTDADRDTGGGEPDAARRGTTRASRPGAQAGRLVRGHKRGVPTRDINGL